MSRLPGLPLDTVRDQPSAADRDGGRVPSRPRVRLRAGVMRYHVLTAGRPERTWRLSGLIDFEPAMHGYLPPDPVAGSARGR